MAGGRRHRKASRKNTRRNNMMGGKRRHRKASRKHRKHGRKHH
jgi:hypothetical protein